MTSSASNKRRPLGRAKVLTNRLAKKEYSLEEKLAAGVVLTGSQVKAIRNGRANITGSYARILHDSKAKKPQLWLVGAHIEGEEDSSLLKLLVTKDQLSKLIGVTTQKQLTIVAARGYFSHGFFKIELGIGRRLKKEDRRDKLRRADLQRQAERDIRNG